MKREIVYHGSYMEIEFPEIRKHRFTKDFIFLLSFEYTFIVSIFLINKNANKIRHIIINIIFFFLLFFTLKLIFLINPIFKYLYIINYFYKTLL